MASKQKTLDKELGERLRKLVFEKYSEMQEVTEIGDIKVATALVDDDIEKLVLLVLEEAKQPLSWRDLKAIFGGIVGEDRLRRILGVLKARNEVAELSHTRFALPAYVPLSEINKVKNPGIISKILELKKGEIQ
jgi:hypothetical protein